MKTPEPRGSRSLREIAGVKTCRAAIKEARRRVRVVYLRV